ncbi:PilN domain-containing protein [Marinobacter sp. chi1]|uniref:PilN domain-containing protein n=1 Tax=Marinobacter suaedae TaxID=3057675 RepID=A0ABT8W4L9_9GAMM|nr:PilN domain-containing protein [Marinobacter sp. chi1]MDO3723177.1 PilN domain-containing protein [Marinobacter sp. chi1]
MSQSVNLYTEDLRPRRESLQAGTLVVLVALVVVGLVAGSGLAHYQSSELQAQIEKLEADNRGLEQSIERQTEAVLARRPSPEIREQLVDVTEQLARRQRLLERVENLVLGVGGQFSPQMAALARQIPDDVWLTGVWLDAEQSQVALEGLARSGALVPSYLENLGDEPAFSGRTFGAFRLSRPENERGIRFHVATDRDGEDS